MEKQKKIPALRFPEFNCEWQRNKLGEIFAISAGGDVASENVRLIRDEIFKYPIYANAEKNKGFYGYSDIYKVDENVITVAGRGVNIGIAHARDHKFYPIVRLLVLKTKNGENINFFEYQINRLNLIKESTGVPQLTAPQVSKYKIYYPFYNEQTKIATFIAAVDDKLTLLKKKKNFLEQYKNGVVQKIFDQEIRFQDDEGNNFPAWEMRILSEIATIATGSSNRQDSTLVGDYAFFDRSQDIRSSSIFLFDGEAIIVAGEGQEFIPKYFTGKFDLHQRTYSIMNFIKTNGKFLFYQIDKFRYYFLSQAVGSTVKSLRLPMFEKMPILLPCLAEQTKIADFLSAIDDKINLCSSQIEKTEQYKRGLLQQMFV